MMNQIYNLHIYIYRTYNMEINTSDQPYRVTGESANASTQPGISLYTPAGGGGLPMTDLDFYVLEIFEDENERLIHFPNSHIY